MRILSLIAMVLVLLPAAAGAQVMPMINYQGVLTDAGGIAVADGSYDVTFSLYNVTSGGSPLWTEAKTVQVAKGIFSAMIGETVWLDLPFDEPYWLGISIEGEAELSPRIMLASAPYSMSSGGVYGGNWFPGTGYVGIHTDSPDYPLEVWSADNQVSICAHSADPDWASIYMRADDPGSRPGYGYLQGSTLVAHHYVNPGGAWALRVGGTHALYVNPSGSAGIGVSTPLERLDVDGAVRLGAAAGNFAGTVQWTGTDFAGYDGSQWLSLTGAGAGGLPAGTIGQTLRHNGSDWIATGNLYNAGDFIGIGTTSPEMNLHVRSVNTAVLVEASSSTGSAGLMARATGGTQDYALLQKLGSDLGGSKAGIPYANLSLLQVGSQAGPLMIDVIPPEPVHFVIDNKELMRLSATGELMLRRDGTTMLSAYTDVDGGHLQLNDAAGFSHTVIQTHPNGVGGYLSIMRNQVQEGFRLEGNSAGTNEPFMAIWGSSQEAEFDFNSTGDFSVQLPVNAVGDAEILDEPGVASDIYSETTGIGLSMGAYTVIASRSITVPDGGYVLVMGTANIVLDHTSGAQTSGLFGVSHVQTSLMSNQNGRIAEPASAATGVYEQIVSCHGLFEVVGEGTTTFNLLGFLTGGAMTAYDVQLTLVYLPTAYGTVEPTFTVDPVMASAPDAAERAASIADNGARAERELEAMRERIARLERRLAAEDR